MREVENYLKGLRERARKIDPGVYSVSVAATERDHQKAVPVRYYCAIHSRSRTETDEIEFGPTVEAAVRETFESLERYERLRRAAKYCVVCAATGTETAAHVTTGQGMMCHAHAIEWLQSEKEASEESVGPCGVKS